LNLAATENIEVIFIQPTITLNVTAEANGTVSPSGSQILTVGQPYSFVAIANTGYVLDHWVLGIANVGSSNPYNLTATVDLNGQTLTAYFSTIPPQQITMNIVANPTDGGTTLPSAGQHQFNVGTLVQFTATCTGKYVFTNWTLDGLTYTNNPLGLTIATNMNGMTLTANFILPTATITVGAGANGSVNPSGVQTLIIGETYQYNAISSIGYYLDHWDLGGANIGSTNPLPLTATSTMDGKTLTAIFTAVPPQQVTLTVAVNVEGIGTVTPSTGSHQFNIGDTVQFTATPATGYVFAGWTLDGQTFANSPLSLAIVNALDGKTLTAIFIKPTRPSLSTIGGMLASIPIIGYILTR